MITKLVPIKFAELSIDFFQPGEDRLPKNRSKTHCVLLSDNELVAKAIVHKRSEDTFNAKLGRYLAFKAAVSKIVDRDLRKAYWDLFWQHSNYRTLIPKWKSQGLI